MKPDRSKSEILRPPLRGEPGKAEAEKSNKRGALFLVAYELEQLKDYGGLSSELRKMEGVQILGSVWVVNDSDPDAIRQKLQPRMDPSDRLFITRIARDCAYFNLTCGDIRKLF